MKTIIKRFVAIAMLGTLLMSYAYASYELRNTLVNSSTPVVGTEFGSPE